MRYTAEQLALEGHPAERIMRAQALLAALEEAERESIRRGVRLTHLALSAWGIDEELTKLFGNSIPGADLGEMWSYLKNDLERLPDSEEFWDMGGTLGKIRHVHQLERDLAASRALTARLVEALQRFIKASDAHRLLHPETPTVDGSSELRELVASAALRKAGG